MAQAKEPEHLASPLSRGITARLARPSPSRVAFLLMAGTLFNLFVAWALHLSVRASGPPGPVSYTPRAGGVEWPVRVPYAWPPEAEVCFPRRGWGVLADTYAAQAPSAGGNSAPESVSLTVHAAGFPMLAFQMESMAWWSAAYAPQQSFISRGLLVPPWLPGSRTWDQAYVPIRPIPLGFAVNTAAYTVLFYLMFGGFTEIRRFLRLRAGLCPACKYPIGGSPVCTECGRELPARRQPA